MFRRRRAFPSSGELVARCLVCFVLHQYQSSNSFILRTDLLTHNNRRETLRVVVALNVATSLVHRTSDAQEHVLECRLRHAPVGDARIRLHFLTLQELQERNQLTEAATKHPLVGGGVSKSAPACERHVRGARERNGIDEASATLSNQARSREHSRDDRLDLRGIVGAAGDADALALTKLYSHGWLVEQGSQPATTCIWD